jgi:FkbM family methyltransferase
MKDQVVLKDEKWIWPSADENSWQGQNDSKDLHEVVMPHVINKNIMIQAGGNCGFILSTFVPYFEHVYTFEPDPINFYCLTQNVTSPNVTKLQMCLSEHNDSLNVQQLVREGRLHDIGGVHVAGNGFTPAIAIDSLNLPGCGLLQLDVEGYELKALKGAINTIKKYKPVICVELCEKWLNRYNDTSENVVSFIENLGYIKVDSHRVDNIFIPIKG